MVGQKKILEDLNNLKQNKSFPRFVIISGMKGSGRKTLTRALSKMLGAFLVECELGVDNVRDAVHNCYKCSVPTVYQFADADKMSAAAKNALLKITEEPPRQAYFVITVTMADNMLETLRSRAMCIQMEPYSKEELVSVCPDAASEIFEVAEVPGQVLQMNGQTFEEVMSFCNMVADNITKVTGVNAFKIVNRIKLKEDKEGFEPDLFFQCLRYVLYQRAVDSAGKEALMWSKMLKLTCKYQREFNMTGVKKDSTLDMWILEMRECG